MQLSEMTSYQMSSRLSEMKSAEMWLANEETLALRLHASSAGICAPATWGDS